MELSDSIVATLTSWTDLFMRRTMRNFLLYAKQNGFSLTQVSAIFMLHRKGTCSVSDIGDELEITSPAASQLLDRLVEQGLVMRTEDPIDRRHKKITLSKKGEVILNEGMRLRQRWLEELVQLMSPEEQAQVLAGINIMLDKVHQLDHQTVPEF